MNNYVFLFIIIAIYISLIVFFILKINHIKKYPQRYENKELELQGDLLESSKKYCHILKSLSHQYGTVGFLFGLILTILAFMIALGVNKLHLIGYNDIFQGASLIGSIGFMFLNFYVGMAIIPLSIKTPFFEVSTRDMLNVYGRPAMYKRAYFFTFIIFIVAMPFAILSMNNYCGYSENEIRYSQYLQIDETKISYDKIDKVFIEVSHDNKGKITQISYVVQNNRNKFNINTPNMGTKYITKDAFTIHKYIEEKSECNFEVVPLTASDVEYFTSNLSEERIEMINYIFEVRD